MEIRMKLHSKLITTSIAAALLTTGCASMSNNESTNYSNEPVSTADGYRQVGYAAWNKTGSVAQSFDNASIPANQSRIVFIRSKAAANSGANIGIDNRYQVSLQGGSYSSVYVCDGDHKIGITPSSKNTNNLSLNTTATKSEAGETQYYYVDVDNTNTPRLRLITEQSALTALQNSPYTQQTHQISRVIAANCKPPVQKPEIKVEIDKPITLNVEFDYDAATIRPQYNARLVAVAKFMESRPNTIAVIEGHTDNRGNDAYNQDLSEQRAAAVRQQLVVRYGVDPERITSKGYGETRPVASNDTDAGRQRNRRVDALITLKK